MGQTLSGGTRKKLSTRRSKLVVAPYCDSHGDSSPVCAVFRFAFVGDLASWYRSREMPHEMDNSVHEDRGLSWQELVGRIATGDEPALSVFYDETRSLVEAGRRSTPSLLKMRVLSGCPGLRRMRVETQLFPVQKLENRTPLSFYAGFANQAPFRGIRQWICFVAEIASSRE